MYRVQCAWLVAIGEIHAVLSAGPARLPRAEGRTGQGGAGGFNFAGKGVPAFDARAIEQAFKVVSGPPTASQSVCVRASERAIFSDAILNMLLTKA